MGLDGTPSEIVHWQSCTARYELQRGDSRMSGHVSGLAAIVRADLKRSLLLLQPPRHS
jgi:hypothetical protein